MRMKIGARFIERVKSNRLLRIESTIYPWAGIIVPFQRMISSWAIHLKYHYKKKMGERFQIRPLTKLDNILKFKNKIRIGPILWGGARGTLQNTTEAVVVIQVWVKGTHWAKTAHLETEIFPKLQDLIIVKQLLSAKNPSLINLNQNQFMALERKRRRRLIGPTGACCIIYLPIF